MDQRARLASLAVAIKVAEPSIVADCEPASALATVFPAASTILGQPFAWSKDWRRIRGQRLCTRPGRTGQYGRGGECKAGDAGGSKQLTASKIGHGEILKSQAETSAAGLQGQNFGRAVNKQNIQDARVTGKRFHSSTRAFSTPSQGQSMGPLDNRRAC